ncbi:D-alanyl-D-alanine carboxypeptidase family protein [Piscibacillus salipiscarius]|uniref:D-alanyl-D-alanine carboxypeptidase family protein n=1 Tax=Piscibacillus salipiscarius TaxID=299480 RepID=A0ABW5Q634_9BACI
MFLTRVLIPILIIILLTPFQIFGEEHKNININSEAAILVDANSGEVLYSQSAEKSMYPASITKIVTAIIAIEQGNLGDTVTVSENARNVIGTRVYLEPGEQVKMEKLVKGLLLNSGNDAGVAIAEHMDGSVEDFSDRMNRFVKEEIGVTNSNFENPHGLYDPKHVTTASDMAKITQYAMQNETFREIVGTKQMEWDGEGWDTTLYNHHRLVRQRDDVTGVKNGFVSQSGFTLVSSASQEHLDLIVVTLNSTTADAAYQDTNELLDYGFENFKTFTVEATSQNYQIGNREYIFEDDFVFTADRNLVWTHEVNQQGQLIIKNDQGMTIDAYDLQEVLPASTNNNTPEAIDHTKTELNQFSSWGIVSSTIVIIAGLLIVKIVRKRRKNRMFY